LDSEALETAQITAVDLQTLLSSADAVSLHVSLNSSSEHLIDKEALRIMKPGAWLINTSRGRVIDEPALIDSLARGHLGGAGLDVFRDEPLPLSSPLRELPQVVFGSHNASNTEEAVARTNKAALKNLFVGLGRP
jgi:phosphoglycerate dehydrogenase-like enzyme